MLAILYSEHRRILRESNKRMLVVILVLVVFCIFGVGFFGVSVGRMQEEHNALRYQLSVALAREDCLLRLRSKPMTVGQALDIVDVILSQKEVPVPLVLAVMSQESQFSPWAQSDKNAVGLMQMMPMTFKLYMVNPILQKMPRDPSLNVQAAIAHLADLSNQYKDWKKVLRVYYAGPDHANNKNFDGYVNSILQKAERYGWRA